ncbi:hypothetical protein LCGC14_1305070 [marine sediment metagenome]|uniref:Uncharacterized protein n=1 Tax=marine sediment metagenome TaxID=412755 RepID=A0A0F9KNZ0_9ZZZZ
MGEIDYNKYTPLYNTCKEKGTLHWENFDTFCEVLDALEKANISIKDQEEQEGTKEDDDEYEYKDPCPECGKQLVSAIGGGVKCNICSYWFCF